MKQRIYWLKVLLLVLGINNLRAQDYTSYVDPYIGAGGHGHVFVGASVPFGAVQVGANNFYKGWDWCSGYNYNDSLIIGFAQTHLNGTGIGGLGDVLMMPYTGPVKIDKATEKEHGKGYASLFSHKNETVQPGYYSVTLDDYAIKAEMTATERVGFHQYHFPAKKEAHVIIDLKEGINDQSTETYIHQVDRFTLEGYRFSKGWAKDQCIFFAIQSSVPLDHLTLYELYVKNLTAIPADKERRSVAKGLEYAIGDGSVALLAQKLNKLEDHQYYLKRAENYKRYYDPVTHFFRGKLSNGSWAPEFDPLRANNNVYAEGNAWQYLWLVPQDVNGLIDLLGGEALFNKRLDSMFSLETPPATMDLMDLTGTIGQYAHGNEPSHHIAYLYTYGGRQWKTAEKVRYIMKEMYYDRPDGIIGNEDCGQMSAWYIFNALGFYPVFPASGKYVIGSPVIDKATIQLPGGKQFTVTVENNSDHNIYVQEVELNGKIHNHSYLFHTDIVNGGTLKIKMGATPNTAFGLQKTDRP